MIRPEDFELNWNEVYNPYSNTHKVTFSTGSEVKELLINSYEDSNEFFSQIEEALKRNEPIKPKVAWKNEEDKEIVAYRCLNCNGSLGAKLDNKPMFPNFCRHCGQKLDWSDEK